MARAYLDEVIAKGLAPLLRECGHDIMHTEDAGNKGLKDPRQLAFAARTGRILITSNRRDFEMLHLAWLAWSEEWGIGTERSHAGILVLPSGSIEAVARMAAAIDRFLKDTQGLGNRIFSWRERSGWQELHPG